MFTYPCVQGGMHQIDQNEFFGFSLSHATGCSVSGYDYFDVWLHRNIQQNDNKGIQESMIDAKVSFYSFNFYIQTNESQFLK